MHFTAVIFFILISVPLGSFLPQYEMLHHPQPYAFGYTVKDHQGEQHREETGDGGHSVRGSYGFTDNRGVHRQVNYVADHGGFRAEVKTNEPGTANQDPAAVKMVSSAHPGGYGIAGGLLGGPIGIVDYGYHHQQQPQHVPIAVVDAPLHGGHVAGYDSRFGHY